MTKVGLALAALSAMAGLISYFAAHSWPAVIGSAVFFSVGAFAMKGGD